MQSDAFHFADVGALLDPPTLPQNSTQKAWLKPVLDLTMQKISEWAGQDSNILVILDDISPLEWIGYPTTDLLRFIRALSATCRKVQHIFITIFDFDMY